MAGNIAIFEGNGKINIDITDEDGVLIYRLQGMGGQVQIDDEDKTLISKLQSLDPDVHGEVILMEDCGDLKKNIPINGERSDKEQAEAEPEKIEELEDDLPNSTWKKAQLKDYMDENSIEYNSGDTKGDLLDKINS